MGAPPGDLLDGPHGAILPVHLRNGDGGRGSSGAKSILGHLFTFFFSPFTVLPRHWDTADIANAGWHCPSRHETTDELMHKLESVSHMWMNHWFFRNRERAAYYVRQGLDLWGRPTELYDHIDDNMDIPGFLLEYVNCFCYLLNRDGESAGFSDYPP